VLHPLSVVTLYGLVPGKIVLECNIHVRLSSSQINLPHLPNELESHKPTHRTREHPDNVVKTEFFITEASFGIHWSMWSSIFLSVMMRTVSLIFFLIEFRKYETLEMLNYFTKMNPPCEMKNSVFTTLSGCSRVRFNNISVISWRLVLLVEETGEPGENHCPVASHWQALSHNVVSSTPNLRGIQNKICWSNVHNLEQKRSSVMDTVHFGLGNERAWIWLWRLTPLSESSG
jgi:hypothetical protein